MEQFEKHPCFSTEAKHKYGRLHIPVAPKCNIQCNYCNRKYDCVNESRPGVSSVTLGPRQALSYVRRIMEKQPNIAVVGIAGPGDAFAQAEDVLKSMRLIKEEFPALLICLSSNGLELPEYVDDIAEIGVSHVTITVNAVDPVIGAKIYSWVRYQKHLYRGVEGAKLLMEKQLLSIRLLKEKGITVKVNTVIIPGVNDFHVGEIARTVSALGADLLNCIPMYPTEGTPLENVPKADPGLMEKIRLEAGAFLPQMRHCQRCRADAVGLLGEAMTNDAVRLLQECAALPLNPLENRPLVAVASMEGLLVNQHLGEAKELWIYKAEGEEAHLVEKRTTPPAGCGDERWEKLAEILSDTRALLVSGIGKRPKEILKDRGIEVYEVEGLIEDGLDVLFKGGRIKTLGKVTRCGESCAGTGLGCG